MCQDLLDYEVDSDDEWEEEEPGESLSHSEGVRRRSIISLCMFGRTLAGVVP